ncbi:protein Star [Procambarus clarkii]|uniref:protein Star n=1 Tax=Procambarus clarkii TaxID=6728 RepID=UPI001E675ABD|nr:protein Star-like [Procambarus clarkii]
MLTSPSQMLVSKGRWSGSRSCRRWVAAAGVVLGGTVLVLHPQESSLVKEQTLPERVYFQTHQLPVNSDDAVRQLTNKTFAGLEQDDPALVSYVRQLIIPPSTKAYNLTNPTKVHFSQYDQSAFAEENFLNGMGGGFFLEMGALDGEDHSNTLYFEKYRGWSGLLIEPDPKLFQRLSDLNRKAYSINAAVSLSKVSALATFRSAEGEGRIWEGVQKGEEGAITVLCFPLYTVLLAINLPTIDFFSLDIEGHEMRVMKALPWEKVKVRVMCIEVNHVPGGVKAVIEFMESRGYTFLGTRNIDAWFGLRELLQETMDLDKYLQQHKIDTLRLKLLSS